MVVMLAKEAIATGDSNSVETITLSLINCVKIYGIAIIAEATKVMI